VTDPIDTKARELLAAAYENGKFRAYAPEIRSGVGKQWDEEIAAISAALRAAPEGYVLVPVEPTDTMVGYGAESKPMSPFTPLEEMEAFEEMTGCEQARHVAKLCWAAMIAARPGEGA